MTRFWHSRVGRLVCRLDTLGQHVWKGWPQSIGSGPLPLAHCDRCGAEF